VAFLGFQIIARESREISIYFWKIRIARVSACFDKLFENGTLASTATCKRRRLCSNNSDRFAWRAKDFIKDSRRTRRGASYVTDAVSA